MKSNFDYITIKHYLEGKLDPQSMHDVEKCALDDPFLADAIEGYRVTNIPPENHLSILQRQLERRIALQQEKKNALNFSWQRLSIAAAAGLMFITAGILFWMNSFKPDTKQASKEKSVEVNLSELSVASQVTADSQIISDKATVYFQDIGASQAQPKGGWLAYGEYIRKSILAYEGLPDRENLQIPVTANREGIAAGDNSLKGNVILEFNVNSEGKPENFKIIRGLSEASNKEAIRLIKDGPEWIPAGSEKIPEIRISVKF